MYLKIYIISLLLIFESFDLFSLTVDIDSLSKDEITNAQPDTFKLKPLNELILNKPEPSKKYEMTKSPTKAVLLSFLYPGLGQYYVESYWKVPVFFGASAGLIYSIIHYNNLYQPKQEEWDLKNKINPFDPELQQISAWKEYYRDTRDQMYFYLGGVYILAAIDAYVGAHLFDFNVSDDLSVGFINSGNGLLNVGIQYKW